MVLEIECGCLSFLFRILGQTHVIVKQKVSFKDPAILNKVLG